MVVGSSRLLFDHRWLSERVWSPVLSVSGRLRLGG
jgi:hypothetical protein